MSFCRVAYLTCDGRTVELTSAERAAVMLADRQARRAVLRASRMYGTRGTLVLLRDPGLGDLGPNCVPNRVPESSDLT
jgi:hypothetical protein